MYFLMICHHNTDVDALRDELRPKHRDWVKSGGDGLAVVLTGSALWDGDGKGIGNFGILEADSFEKAEAFANNDPFALGGVVRSVEFTRLADGFQAGRIDPMTQR